MTPTYNVLLVDDDAWSLCILENIVAQHQQLTIFKAENGSVALEILKKETIDFLVTDFSMPGMNGTALMKAGEAVHPDLITVIQSAANELATAIDTIKNGAFDFITKPLDAQHLLLILDKCIEKKLLTQQLKEQSERLKLLMTAVEQSTVSIEITDSRGRITYVNPAAVTNSGFSEQELLGTRLQYFGEGMMAASLLAELNESIATGRMWQGPFKSRRKDDSILEEDVSISPVCNQAGALTHFVIIKRDITEMANLQRQLLQAQKLEAIGQLAAGIAHEINTPMQYVHDNVTFLEQSFQDLLPLLLAGSSPEGSPQGTEAAARLDTLELDFLLKEIPVSIKETHEGIKRVVNIISAMKTFSHPGGTSMVATDLNHAVESTIIVCSNEWRIVAEMITEFDPDLPLVPCFPDQLNQVILNLIINAVHAIAANPPAARGLGTIRVVTGKEDDWIVIAISDTGGGIPEAIQQRIFEPFFTTKEVGKGTGQGLALAHDIVVNKHGGRIDFTSKPGQGTTFLIRLPQGPQPTKANSARPL